MLLIALAILAADELAGIYGIGVAVMAQRADQCRRDVLNLVDPALGWHDLEALVGECSVPVLVKGVMAAEDAVMAAEHGAAGVIVSNHGGRQLDGAAATIDALGEVADAVGDRIEVLMDGGVRRGTDVLTALALGAKAVMVGRPTVWGSPWRGGRGEAGARSCPRNELEAGADAVRLPGARVRLAGRSSSGPEDRQTERTRTASATPIVELRWPRESPGKSRCAACTASVRCSRPPTATSDRRSTTRSGVVASFALGLTPITLPDRGA